VSQGDRSQATLKNEPQALVYVVDKRIDAAGASSYTRTMNIFRCTGLACLSWLVVGGCGSAQNPGPDLPGAELPPDQAALAGEYRVNEVDVRPKERAVGPVATAKTWGKPRIGTEAPADVAGPPRDAQLVGTAVRFRTLHEGEGGKVGAGANVVVHYSGWTTDGKLFDSSVSRGEPLRIGLGSVIAGWTTGVGDMQLGEVRRLWIPESLAYQGKEGAPKGMLVFDVELLALDE